MSIESSTSGSTPGVCFAGDAALAGKPELYSGPSCWFTIWHLSVAILDLPQIICITLPSPLAPHLEHLMLRDFYLKYFLHHIIYSTTQTFFFRVFQFKAWRYETQIVLRNLSSLSAMYFSWDCVCLLCALNFSLLKMYN